MMGEIVQNIEVQNDLEKAVVAVPAEAVVGASGKKTTLKYKQRKKKKKKVEVIDDMN